MLLVTSLVPVSVGLAPDHMRCTPITDYAAGFVRPGRPSENGLAVKLPMAAFRFDPSGSYVSAGGVSAVVRKKRRALRR